MPSAGVLLHRVKWSTGELLHGVLLLEYCCWITAAFSMLKAVTVQQLAAPTLLLARNDKQGCCTTIAHVAVSWWQALTWLKGVAAVASSHDSGLPGLSWGHRPGVSEAQRANCAELSIPAAAHWLAETTQPAAELAEGRPQQQTATQTLV